MLQKFFGLFSKKPEPVPDPVVKALLASMQTTYDDECDCGEFFDKLDQYADADIKGEDAARLMPLIKHHLELCRECGEEYEALLRVLEEKAGSVKTEPS